MGLGGYFFVYVAGTDFVVSLENPPHTDTGTRWSLNFSATKEASDCELSFHHYTPPSSAACKNDRVGKVFLCNCRLSIRNPDNQEVVYTQIYYNEHPCQVKIYACGTRIITQTIDSYSQYVYKGMLSVQVEADLIFLCSANILDNIHADMYSLYKAEKLTDIVIQCDNKEFKVHKTVLAAQSPVFQAMFEADMKEARCGVVEVSGITSSVMSDLVTYLYTGTAPNLETLANELLDAASKYQIPRLLKMCEDELQRNMKDSNVLTTLIQADLYSNTDLKKRCLNFVCENRMTIFRTKEWMQVLKDQFTSLYVEALDYCMHTRCSTPDIKLNTQVRS